MEDLRDEWVRVIAERESLRREQLVVEALWSGAFLNELGAVAEAGRPESWRLW